MAQAGSVCIGHEPCPKCNSRDNLGRYDDGHGYCYGCGHYEPSEGEASTAPSKQHAPRSERPLLRGDATDLPKRGLLKATCEKWRYYTATDEKGKGVQIATYCNEAGQPVAQKIRYADKRMEWRGDKSATGLFGAHLWRDGGRQVVVTEGEIDALSVSQVFKWPVVSIPDGAGPQAAKAIRKNISFFDKFEKVILLFDNDDIGRRAAEECAALLKPGKAHIATLPLKDANDMLVAARGEELINAIWDARPFRPDGIITGTSLVQKALRQVAHGLPWFDPDLTAATFGRRGGEVVTIGAGTGVGKTDFLIEQIAHDLFTLNQTVGVVFLEQMPEDTLRRIIGKWKGKRFYAPDGSWTHDELEAAFAEAQPYLDKLHLYDNFGASDWATIESRLRYLSVGAGAKLLYLDHLTALAAHEEDERKALESITASIAMFAQEQNAWVCVVSHLATPEGKSHEEGGRVTIRQFKGSRAIGYWSHFMFGLERDQQAEDEGARGTTVLRCLKDRYTGNATGQTWKFAYDKTKGRLTRAPDDLAEAFTNEDF